MVALAKQCSRRAWRGMEGRATGRYLDGLGILVAGAGMSILEGYLLILAAHARSARKLLIVSLRWARPRRRDEDQRIDRRGCRSESTEGKWRMV